VPHASWHQSVGSSFYLESTAENEETLRLMRLVDQQVLETLWYGSRQMARHLRRNGWSCWMVSRSADSLPLQDSSLSRE
jgi:hypothetical protein